MTQKSLFSSTYTLLQSEEWAHFQESLGKKVFHVSEKTFEYYAILEQTRLGSYLYLPYGPLIATKNAADLHDAKSSLRNATNSLASLARDNHCIFIRIEPRIAFTEKVMTQLGYTKSHDLSPADTWVLDLTQDATDLIPSRLMRYYKKMASNHLDIITSQDPSDLHYLVDLQKSLMTSKNLNSYDIEYYKKQLAAGFATLYLLRQTIDDTTTVLAAGLVFDHEGTRYNLQGAQSNLGRSLHATGILTVQLILDAIASGKTTFDFWGIAPDGAPETHPWAGFTGFKKTFTGTALHFSGTYDFPVNKSKYRLYQALRSANRLLRKVRK